MEIIVASVIIGASLMFAASQIAFPISKIAYELSELNRKLSNLNINYKGVYNVTMANGDKFSINSEKEL